MSTTYRVLTDDELARYRAALPHAAGQNVAVIGDLLATLADREARLAVLENRLTAMVAAGATLETYADRYRELMIGQGVPQQAARVEATQARWQAALRGEREP